MIRPAKRVSRCPARPSARAKRSSRLSRSNCSLEMTCSSLRVLVAGVIGDALRRLPIGRQRNGTGTSRPRSPCQPHGTCLKWIRREPLYHGCQGGPVTRPGAHPATKALRRSRDIPAQWERFRGRGFTLPAAMVPAKPGRRRFFRRPRITFAARLLLGGVLLPFTLIAPGGAVPPGG